MKDKFLCADLINQLNLSSSLSKKTYLKSLYSSHLKSHRFKTLILTALTLGFYLRFLRKRIKQQFYNQLSLKKICLYPELESKIGKIREKTLYTNPKASIQAIYKEILQNKEDECINKLYSKSELLLFISSPIEDEQILTTFQKSSLRKDHYRDWQYMKQSSRHDEIQNIKKINHCYSLLKNRYLLTKEEVNKRLTRTSYCHNNLSQLTILKIVRLGFEELLASFEIYSSLKKSNHPLYEIFSSFMNVHREENTEILAHLDGDKTLFELSISSKRFLLDFSSKFAQLKSLPIEDLKNSPCLIFSENQELLFKRLLNSVDTLREKVDQLLTGSYSQVAPSRTIYEKIKNEAKFISNTENNKSHFQNIPSEIPQLFTKNFFEEPGLIEKPIEIGFKGSLKEIKNHEELYKELYSFCESDENLFAMLQELTSSKGRHLLANSIREGLTEQFGQNPLIENLEISKIQIQRIDSNKLEISYRLSHDLSANKNELHQSFIKKQDQWQLA